MAPLLESNAIGGAAPGMPAVRTLAPCSSAPFNATSPQYRALLKKMMALGLPDAQWQLIRDDELTTGHLFPFLVMLRHLLDTTPGGPGPAPHAVAEVFREQRWFVLESGDERFVHAVFRLLRAHFLVAPALKEHQFLRPGQFAADKAAVVSTLASLLHQRERELVARGNQQRSSIHQRSAAAATDESTPPAPLSVQSARARALAVIDSRVVDDAANRSSNGGAPCCGLNASDAVARCRFEREAADAAARRHAEEALLDARHRALTRVPRRAPDHATQRCGGSATVATAAARGSPRAMAAAREDTCWYCSAALPTPRRPGTQPRPCTACGSPPPQALRRSELNAGNLSAHSTSSSSLDPAQAPADGAAP